jgi:hypothetical protein
VGSSPIVSTPGQRPYPGSSSPSDSSVHALRVPLVVARRDRRTGVTHPLHQLLGGSTRGWPRGRGRDRPLVEPEALTGAYKYMRRGIVALVFRCRIASGAPRATDEAAEWRWMGQDEIRTSMDEAYAVRLLDALRPGPPAIRAHDGLELLPA